jgi:hypothetical protein
MRRLFLVVGLAVVFTQSVGSGMALAGGIGAIASAKVYGVNIIGYDNCPKSENAQRIAVLGTFTEDVLKPNGTFDPATFTLDKTNKIYIIAGPDFRVLNSNACEPTDGARLQLPPQAPTEYNVFVRLVGRPDSTVTAFSCATLLAVNQIVCGTSFPTKTRLTGKGEPSFTNVTNNLLKIGGTQIFDPTFEEAFWVWNTTGRPHAQVWFVDCTEYGSCI